MRNILSWSARHFQLVESHFFDALDQIIPSFASKTVDEKFAFIMECKDYDIACVCLTNIWKMFRARDSLISNINASHRTNATNALWASQILN